MRLAAATTKRFIAENQFFIHREGWLRHEEPFALAAKGAVLTGVTLAGRDMIARERVMHILGLECIHRLADAGSAAGHGSDEPFAFVMAAEEAIRLRLAEVAGAKIRQTQAASSAPPAFKSAAGSAHTAENQATLGSLSR